MCWKADLQSDQISNHEDHEDLWVFLVVSMLKISSWRLPLCATFVRRLFSIWMHFSQHTGLIIGFGGNMLKHRAYEAWKWVLNPEDPGCWLGMRDWGTTHDPFFLLALRGFVLSCLLPLWLHVCLPLLTLISHTPKQTTGWKHWTPIVDLT